MEVVGEPEAGGDGGGSGSSVRRTARMGDKLVQLPDGLMATPAFKPAPLSLAVVPAVER